MKKIKLLDKYVGDGSPCYIVSEIGGLFRNFEEAKRLIDAAIEIKVDAIKFQTLEAETVTTKNNFFDMEATGHISQYELLKEFEIPKDLQLKIVKYANKKKMPIFSAPSHLKDLETIKEMDLPFIKIGSDLACHIPLLKEVAKMKKPIILSTGMCDMEDVREAVRSILEEGNENIILLHCVSNYPAKPEEVNLKAILTMKKEFNLPVGLSDHCIGTTTSLAAAVLGANMIERHLKDEKNTSSPDDIHALNKNEFQLLVESIRISEAAMGTGKKTPTDSEKKNMKTNRVSIVSLQDIMVGNIITKEMIDVRRPGTGIHPKFYEKVIGMKAKINIPKETPITFDMLE